MALAVTRPPTLEEILSELRPIAAPHPPITPATWRVYCALRLHAQGYFAIYGARLARAEGASLSQIGETARVAKRTVGRALSLLEELGAVYVEESGRDQKRPSVIWCATLNFNDADQAKARSDLKRALTKTRRRKRRSDARSKKRKPPALTICE